MTKPEYKCITEREDAHGFYWRYDHTLDEPRETLTAATMIACNVASDMARKYGKTYVVATTTVPPLKVYLLPLDHPEYSIFTMSVVCEITPDGKRISGPWNDPRYTDH
jgi:hypothetical protein